MTEEEERLLTAFVLIRFARAHKNLRPPAPPPNSISTSTTILFWVADSFRLESLMDTKPIQIPTVPTDTVGVHSFFSTAPRRTARVGFEWGGGKAGKHSDGDEGAAIKRDWKKMQRKG